MWAAGRRSGTRAGDGSAPPRLSLTLRYEAFTSLQPTPFSYEPCT